MIKTKEFSSIFNNEVDEKVNKFIEEMVKKNVGFVYLDIKYSVDTSLHSILLIYCVNCEEESDGFIYDEMGESEKV